MASRHPGRTHSGDALSTLLETERRLSTRLDAVARDAEAIVTAAEREAQQRLAALDAELTAQAEALAQSIEAGAANRIEALRRQADAAVARYQGVDEDELRELATRVVDAVLGRPDEEPA